MQCNMIGHIHKLNEQRKYERKKKKEEQSVKPISIVMNLIEMEKNICFVAKTLKL